MQCVEPKSIFVLYCTVDSDFVKSHYQSTYNCCPAFAEIKISTADWAHLRLYSILHCRQGSHLDSSSVNNENFPLPLSPIDEFYFIFTLMYLLLLLIKIHLIQLQVEFIIICFLNSTDINWYLLLIKIHLIQCQKWSS